MAYYIIADMDCSVIEKWGIYLVFINLGGESPFKAYFGQTPLAGWHFEERPPER